MQQEEFEKLTEEQQAELQKASEEISQKTLEKLRLIREKEKDLKDKIHELESQICRVAIAPVMSELRAKYQPNEKLERWLNDFTEDLIANFNVFLAAVRDDQADVDFSRYEVNAFVCNNPNDGAPVISETNPIYYNLVGKVDYENRQGNLYTDFRRITPGAMHRANGGFLLLDADELLRQFMSWDVLKRVLRYRELSIENLAEQLGYIPVSSLRPEPIPVDMKVVIVGTPYLYYLLNIYDPEFSKVFKIKAEFDSEMARTDESEMQIARFIAGFVEREGKLHFTAAAVGEVIEWAARLVEDKNKLSTQLNKIAEILVESTALARAGGKRQVGHRPCETGAFGENIPLRYVGRKSAGRIQERRHPHRHGRLRGRTDKRADRLAAYRPFLRLAGAHNGERLYGHRRRSQHRARSAHDGADTQQGAHDAVELSRAYVRKEIPALDKRAHSL